MQETEDQFRVLAEALPQLIWTARPDGRHDYFNGRWYAFTGLDPGQTSTESWSAVIHPDDRPLTAQRWREALATGGLYEIEYRIRGRDGHYRWFLGRALPIRDSEGRISRWFGTCTDIDGHKRAEEAQVLLARELNHRVKNLFAIASGMVSMTARTAKSTKDMADALRGRLGALSRAHELVRPAVGGLSQMIEATDLGQLVAAILAPYVQGEPERLDRGGPPVPVGPNTTTSLALVLHELATNAAKYGSLSVPEGRLSVAWQVAGEEVRIAWTEAGGPALAEAPQLEGFGSQLARKSIAGQLGGALTHDWRPEGLVVTMTLPIARLAH